jgi:hypothetical protein
MLELSDYAMLSGGQRLTLLTLDRGLAYFTGQALRQDALMLVVPGAQVTIARGARVRLEAREHWSQIAVLEGKVRFASPSAEMDVKEGEMVRVDPGNRTKFYLYREIAPYDDDHWNEERDKLLASATSAGHLPDLHFGVKDLDTGGTWVQMENFGAVWKPKIADGWTPFREGKWMWYQNLGYTWVASEPWGWLPYHYGRWMRTAEAGWFWMPGRSTVFKPGDVYWARTGTIAGWGPLAPEEAWGPARLPQLFLESVTVWAEFAQDARVIDPAGFKGQPKDPLNNAQFAVALPSPAFNPAWLEATRPPLRTGITRILPVISGVAYEDAPEVARAPLPPPVAPPPAPSPAPAGPPPPIVLPIPVPAPPIEIYYPVPVYTGVVVMNPPERREETSGGSEGRRAPRTLHDSSRPTRRADASPPSTPRNEPDRENHVSTPPRATVPAGPPARPAPPAAREEPGRSLGTPQIPQIKTAQTPAKDGDKSSGSDKSGKK